MPYVVPTGGSPPNGQSGASDPTQPASLTGPTSGGGAPTNTGDPGSSVGTQAQAQAQTRTVPDVTAFGWIVGWLVALFLLWSAAQTRIGYALIYWLAVAALILLCLTQYRWIVAVLAPITGAVVTPPTVAYEPSAGPGATPNAATGSTTTTGATTYSD